MIISFKLGTVCGFYSSWYFKGSLNTFLVADLREENCESCTLWHPEKELLIGKVVKTELNLEQVKSERDRLEYELNLLQPPRFVHISGFQSVSSSINKENGLHKRNSKNSS